MLPSLALGPGIDMLPSLALGPGIPCRDDVKVVATSHVIPAGNAGTQCQGWLNLFIFPLGFANRSSFNGALLMQDHGSLV
uniref:Uncharacterized protein n=1 Tax=Candidatus Kentrum sp. FW TaxID=2126338 RepID=A0A450TKU9_9GAMM|nr:MAG: hypothetical protein BECKFW1821B_GA0114236_114210 [Candidatus Kentron sp. FW]